MTETERSKQTDAHHLSPKLVAEAIGASESSVKRWADQGRLRAERTAGGHRRIEVSEAVRFIRESGLSVVRPELLGVAGLEAGQPRDPETRPDVAGAFHSMLTEDRAEEAASLVVSLYVDGASLGWIFDVVIRGALARIGELWEHGPEGIFVEHRATETCLRAIDRLAELLPTPSSGAPKALGGGPENDPYRVPSAMITAILAEAGYDVRNLGPDTPTAALHSAVRHHDPALVWLSFSVPPARPRLAVEEVIGLADAVSPGRVVIGGRGAPALGDIRDSRIERLDGMAAIAGFARAVAVASSSARG